MFKTLLGHDLNALQPRCNILYKNRTPLRNTIINDILSFHIYINIVQYIIIIRTNTIVILNYLISKFYYKNITKHTVKQFLIKCKKLTELIY